VGARDGQREQAGGAELRAEVKQAATVVAVLNLAANGPALRNAKAKQNSGRLCACATKARTACAADKAAVAEKNPV